MLGSPDFLYQESHWGILNVTISCKLHKRCFKTDLEFIQEEQKQSINMNHHKERNDEIMKANRAGRSGPLGISSASRGLLLSLISGFVLSWVTVIVKYMKNIHPGQLAVYRYLAIGIFSLPHLIISQQHVLGPPGSRLENCSLAVISTTAIFLHFIAFRFLPLGEATTLACCYPAFVSVVGKIFLKETIGVLHVISLLSTIIGIALSSGAYQTLVMGIRVYTTEDIYGLSAALGSVLCSGAMFILARKLRNVHSSSILLTGGVVGVIESSVLTALIDNFRLHYRGLQQGLIILLGILSYTGLICVIVAMKHTEAGPVSTMRASSDIFFSFVWQAVIFGDSLDGISVFGAFLVCISIILIGFTQKFNQFLPTKCISLC